MSALAMCGAAVLAALAAPAAARPPPDPDDYLIVAQDPPPPPPVPAPDPPRRATIALASGGMSFAGDHDTALARFGPQAGAGIVALSHRAEPGFEVLAAATDGARGRSYTLASRLVVGSRLRRADGIAPFFAVGFAFAVARLDEDAGKEGAGGLGIGPSAALGLHGYAAHRIYWRLGAGFTGAGIGTFSADLGLGWVIGK